MKPSVQIFVFIILQMVLNFSYAVEPELVAIPKGYLKPFWLGAKSGSSNQKEKNIRKKILIPAFQVMSTQVSVEQFREFLNTHPQWRKNQASKLFTDDSYLKNFETQKKDRPMTWVSWFAAKAYCESKGLRLPTINEWEYIAQASETKKEAFKDKLFLKRILDWYGEPQDGELKPVKSIYKNFYGLWDMHGLVWEWVSDFNSSFVTGESREDTSFNKDMFCGAGGMNSADQENYAAFMRFAFRSSLKAKSSVWNLSFRCAR